MKGLALVAALFSVLLAGCGGGGGDGISAGENRLGGLWNGTVYFEDDAPLDHIAFITESRNAYLIDENEETLSFGQIRTSGNTFSGSFTDYELGGFDSSSGSISGTFSAQSMFEGVCRVDGEQVSTFEFTYDDFYEQGSDLADLEGNYSDARPGYSETVTIDDAGNLTGSNSYGCTYTGTFSIINADINDYGVTLTLRNCEDDDMNRTYHGHAMLTESNDILLFAEGGDYVFGGYARRNTET